MFDFGFSVVFNRSTNSLWGTLCYISEAKYQEHKIMFNTNENKNKFKMSINNVILYKKIRQKQSFWNVLYIWFPYRSIYKTWTIGPFSQNKRVTPLLCVLMTNVFIKFFFLYIICLLFIYYFCLFIYLFHTSRWQKIHIPRWYEKWHIFFNVLDFFLEYFIDVRASYNLNIFQILLVCKRSRCQGKN